MIFDLGTEQDLDELGRLYDDMNDYLAAGVNYPGWKKGIYPIKENAVIGVNNKNLYVLRDGDRIAGSVILSHEPERGYDKAEWKYEGDYEDILVIYTLTLHPDYLSQGAGTALMNNIIELAGHTGIKSIRLDVYEFNAPAIRLYEKFGFEYSGKVDLGYHEYGLDWFKLYEKLL